MRRGVRQVVTARGRRAKRERAAREAFANSERTHMALVGIISDTHGHLSDKAYAALAECDYLIHAGDIGGPEILAQLEALAPTYAVLGNNDFDEYGARVGRFARPTIEDVRFLVAHYPRDVRISFTGCAGVEPGQPLPRVCVHGHTHVPELLRGADARPAELLLCPGSAFRSRNGFPRSVAKVEVAAGRILSARVEDLDGNVVLE